MLHQVLFEPIQVHSAWVVSTLRFVFYVPGFAHFFVCWISTMDRLWCVSIRTDLLRERLGS